MDPPSIVKEVNYSIEFESVILSKVTGFWQKTEKVKIITGEEKRSLEVLSEVGDWLTQSKSNLSKGDERGDEEGEGDE